MAGLKICVIGGGSVYTPELIAGFIAKREELPVEEIVLMDIDVERLNIVGGLAARMVRASGAEISIELTTDRQEAIADADYVVTQIRVGGMAARALDEKLPLAFGVVGQETVGPGGFAKALRTIPVMLDIARDIERLAPHALLLNFTNPAGIVTEALLKHTKVNAIGLCNVPIGMKNMIASWLGKDSAQLTLDYVGLNHLSWVRGVSASGQDLSAQALAAAVAEAKAGRFPFSPELVETLGLIPSYYLRYYYHHDEALAEAKKSEKTRAEIVQEIDAELLKLYADPKVAERPDLLNRRGGAYYSVAAVALISAVHNDKGEVHIVNVRNNGAIPDLPDEAVVEIPAVVKRGGVQPLRGNPLPPSVRGLVQAVKAHEELTVKAAVEGDERSALQALLVHPLVSSFSQARGLWQAIKEANKAHLSHFAKAL
ncbi:MAG: 6-phospho-beta-glucosidase [Candidatus Bipolaricaulota bacterium]|nr:6-phospho-beta-glucosidase [Candidatus Bipolaricaulota bacterium]MDW8126472.1 6-phospho-beta-glucosidase [Candidatus Bipolaricaulota bacterium]